MSVSPVSDLERQVAAFIAAYEELCREHGCMVIMIDSGPSVEDWAEEDSECYEAFAVGCFNDPAFLDQSLEEMRIEDPLWLEAEEDDD